MTCEEFQDIIFTNYIDLELSHEAYNKIKSHIAHCDDCSEFEHSLKETVVNQFKGIEAVELDREIWLNIKDKIKQQEKTKGLNNFNYLKQKLIAVFSVKKPVIAIGGIILSLLLILYLAISPLDNEGSSSYSINDYLEMNIKFLAEFDTYEEIFIEESDQEFDRFFD